MMNHLKESRFETVEEIRKFTTTVLNTSEKSDFWKWSDMWRQLWNSRIAAGVNCFKRDNFSSGQNLIQCCLWDQSRY
jgi:hypothetical protein